MRLVALRKREAWSYSPGAVLEHLNPVPGRDKHGYVPGLACKCSVCVVSQATLLDMKEEGGATVGVL